jgi:DNA polymerase-3 subunit delta'
MKAAEPFSELADQPLITRFLTTVYESGTPSHAYLFCGPLGAGKTETAHLFARALLCPHGSCGECEDCVRVAHRTHPDYHIIEPLGAVGYLAEQIAELIHDVSLAPMRAARKVYLLTRADLLKGSSANALLKTLEEPPANTSFILLARTRDNVLPTLLSRCQVLPFKRIPDEVAAQSLMQQTHCDEAVARQALAAAGGSRLKAQEFLGSASRREVRIAVLETMEGLVHFDDFDVLEAVKRLLLALKQPLDSVKLEQQLQLDASKDYLSKGGMTQLEQQHRREYTSKEREGIAEVLDVARSWLRDILLVKFGRRAEIANNDFHFHIEQQAAQTGEEALVRALMAVDGAQEQIQYNVSKELALEALLFVVRDELLGGTKHKESV